MLNILLYLFASRTRPVTVALTDTSSTGITLARLNILRDGTHTYDVGGTPTTKSGEWVQTGGYPTVGDLYEARYGTITGTSPSGSAIDTWLPITSDLQWYLTNSVFDSCSGTLEIRDAATMTVQGTCTASISVSGL